MWQAQVEQEGFAIVRAVLAKDQISSAVRLIESPGAFDEPGRGGTRDVLNHLPELRVLADCAAVRLIVQQVLGSDAFVVRATLFDKTPDANWKVPWHQDLTIAVKERRETGGYEPWSTKAAVVHVQPPSDVLERMITVRLHLDDCGETNGALRVMPGSHRLGRIDQNTVNEHVNERRSVVCAAQAGDALVMRPLLLHASSASSHPSHRRVLHFDYAVGELSGGLAWRMRQF